MFLQKHRRVNEVSPSPTSFRHGLSTKLQNVLKKISIPEIRSHKKTNNYLNPRNLLIHTTERVFKHQPKIMFKEEKTNNHCVSRSSTQRPSSRQSHGAYQTDLSRRESRIMAAKRYRQKIGKRSDITPLLKAQEEMRESRRTEFLKLSHIQSSERVERYRDLIKEFASEVSGNKKELIKTYWLAGNLKKDSQKHFQPNPEVPVTKIEFNDEDIMNNTNSKPLISKSKRTNISYTSQGKRNHKGSYYNHDDNFIQPW